MSVWKDKVRKGYRYEFQFQGIRYASKVFGAKKEASEAEAAHKKRLKEESGKPTQAAMGFKEVASLYLDYSERKHAKGTYEQKKFVFKEFLKKHGDLPLKSITPQHLHAYLNTRETNNNYNAHRKDLGTLFTFAKQVLKVIDYNPCSDLHKMPHNPKPKRLPTEEELLKLIMAADPKTDEKDLLLALLNTLGRIDEVLRLKWEDVNFETRTITLWTRKRKDGNYESDSLPMNDDLHEVLWKRWQAREQNEWVFFNRKTKDRYNHRPKFMRGLCKRAGINPPFGFHALRHFMASYLADKQKISKITISKLLRHKSLGTTEIYLHSISEGQREAMQGVSGIFNGQKVCGDLCGDLAQKPHTKG